MLRRDAEVITIMTLYSYFAGELKEIPKGLIIYIHHGLLESGAGSPHIVLPPQDEPYIAQNVCLDCAIRRDIGSFTVHLYGLYSPVDKTWLAPNDRIDVHAADTKEYIFRIRFQPHESQFPQLLKKDKKTFDYYFYQCRDDFVHNELTIYLQSIAERDILGLGVIDMFHHCKEKGCNEDEFKNSKLGSGNFPDFLPDSTSQKYKGPILRLKLRHSVSEKLGSEFKNEQDCQTVDIKWRYIVSLWKHIPNYATEDFVTIVEGLVIRIQMMHNDMPKIYTKVDGGKDFELFAPVNEVADVSIMAREKEGYMVIVSRATGIPMTLQFPTLGATRSFVSCLDGYYRMTEDYHHHLNQDVSSPLLRQLHELRCHGPIEKKWAMHRLKRVQELGQYNYLIAQDFSDLTTYKLVFLDVDGSAKCHPIITLQGGKYQVKMLEEPTFDSLPNLLKGYAPGMNRRFQLKECLPPQKPYEAALYLCRKYEEEIFETEQKPKSIKNVVHVVHSVGLTPHKLGQGQFTEVHMGKLNIENETLSIAVKQLRPMVAPAILQDLMECMHISSQWQHPTIVAIRGVCLAQPCRLLMEFADCGNLQDHLRRRHRDMTVMDLVLISEQIAQALLYLQEERTPSVHGNIRCRNILVFGRKSSSRFPVKLADPGLVSLYNREPLAEMTKDRLPWIAAECYPKPPSGSRSKPTIYSDRFAFATTLWEIFSTGDHPYTFKQANQILDSVMNGGIPLARPSQCPDGMYEIMKSCWKHSPEARLSPKELVRNIRTVRYEGDVEDMAVQKAVRENHYAEAGARQKKPTSLLKSVVSPPMMLEDGHPGLSVRAPHNSPGHVASRPLPQVPDESAQDGTGAELDHHLLHIDESCRLGAGHYGEVYKGTYDGRLVAIKRLKAAQYRKCKKDFDQEFRTMVKLRHPNIVQIEGCCRNCQGNPMLIVLEFMDKGCLYEYIRKKRGQSHPPDLLYRFIAEICEGMCYLSEQKVIHRDLAARNVLVSKYEHLKISDFGLSRFMADDRDYYRSNSKCEIPIRWCSPEVIYHRRYSEKSDIWSFSITIWEIFKYGEAPKLIDDRELPNALNQGRRLRLDGIPEDIQGVIRKCWAALPETRPTFTQVRSMIEGIHQNLKASNPTPDFQTSAMPNGTGVLPPW